MQLIPFSEFVKDNPWNLNATKLRYLIKTKPSIEKALKRLSTRSVFVDIEALEDWISNQKFYEVKRKKRS